MSDQSARGGSAARHVYPPADDFVQPRALFRKVMTDVNRDHLVGNIVDHLSHAKREIQLRQTAIFYKVDSEYGTRIAGGLGVELEKVKSHAK